MRFYLLPLPAQRGEENGILMPVFKVQADADEVLVQFHRHIRTEGRRGGCCREIIPRSTNKYSTLNDQCSASATSTPAPTVQPNSGLLWYGRPVRAVSTFAPAPPAAR